MIKNRIYALALTLIIVAIYLVESASPIISQPASLHQPTVTLPNPEAVQAIAKRVNDYWIANRPGPEDNNWSRATYFTGDMAHYQMSGDPRYLNLAWKWAESDSKWQLNGGCKTVFAEYQTPGQTYLALYQIDPHRAKLDCLLSSIEQSTSWGWIEIDLGAPTNINRFSVQPIANRAYRYLIDVKQKPTDPYTMVLDRSDASLEDSTITITPGRYVRVRVIGADGYTGPRVTLAEVRIFGEAAPETNLALNPPVTCSSEPEAENNCAKAVDGKTDTLWSAIVPDEITADSPNWWWVDALYVAAPIYATLSQLESAGVLPAKLGYAPVLFAKFDEAEVQSKLFNRDQGLWYRDARYLTLQSPNGKDIFWSRGNGWAIAALARILATLPPSAPHYQEYLRNFQAMAHALIDKQEQAGYWNENLADPQHCGGPESSGTAFFAYGLAWGINSGYLDRATYLPTLISAWDWLTNTAVQSNPDGLLGYVQPVGDSPACDDATPLPGPSDTADFGVGAFLLAASEVYKLPTSGHFNSTLHLPQVSR